MQIIEPVAVRIPEACRMIGIGRSKLYELIADGTIEIAKIGSVTVIPVAQLKALVEVPARYRACHTYVECLRSRPAFRKAYEDHMVHFAAGDT